jgi:hypothetical protein
MSISLNSGSGTVKSSLDIRKDDFYATPAVAVHALMACEVLPLTIWEPACGDCAIVNILRDNGRGVVATDLVERGCPNSQSGIDFLMERAAPAGVPAIVTNPPFKLAEEFAEHALTLVPQVYLLLRLAFLEGLRWERGLAKHFARCHVFAPRLPFMHRHDFDGVKNSNSGMPFAWFVWDRDHEGSATIGWVNPRRLGT